MEYTSTELRQESAKVYNEVQKSGPVKIVHRSRPDMILMTEEEHKRLTEKSGKK